MEENGGELYEVLDAIGKASRTCDAKCEKEYKEHVNKACFGLLATLGGTLFGALYTLFHSKAASYYYGASHVYKKVSNLVEDRDLFEEESKE